MNKLLLIGSNGQLGSDINKYFAKKYKILPLAHKDLDVSDFNKVDTTILKFKPQLIINTAAYHKVDEVENNIEKAFIVNAFAQQNISKAANKVNACVVFVSTDYVFGIDAKRKNKYKESDVTGPVNMYGISKIVGEQMIKIFAKKYFIVRTSGLFGIKNSTQKGANFVERMIKLSYSRNEIYVVNDQILSPTYTLNMAQNLFELVNTNKYGLYHIASKGHCSWWEFTKEIYKLMRIKTKCNPVNSNFFKTTATRPAFSALSNHNLEKIGLNGMKHWKTNLKNYLKEKKYLN